VWASSRPAAMFLNRRSLEPNLSANSFDDRVAGLDSSQGFNDLNRAICSDAVGAAVTEPRVFDLGQLRQQIQPRLGGSLHNGGNRWVTESTRQ